MYPEDRIDQYLLDVEHQMSQDAAQFAMYHPNYLYGTDVPPNVAEMGAEGDWRELQRVGAKLNVTPAQLLRMGDDKWRLQFVWCPHKTYCKVLSADGFDSPDEAFAICHWNLSNLVPRAKDFDDPMNIFKTKLFPWMVGEMLAKPTDLTIKTVRMQTIESPRGTEQEVVLQFAETDKGLIINKTNARRLAGLLGPETDEWIGVKVTLYAERIQAFGKMVDAIRVADNLPKQPTKTAEKRVAGAAKKAEAAREAEAQGAEASEARREELANILADMDPTDPDFENLVLEYADLGGE